MDWIEMLQLRAYAGKDREQAVMAFHQIFPAEQTAGADEVALFVSPTIGTDLAIFIRWQKKPPPRGKSSLGLQLADTFSEFGQIYHTVWTRNSNPMVNQGEYR